MGKSTTAELSNQLSAHPFFVDLDKGLLWRIAESGIWREYGAGEIVVLEGEALPGLYYLEYGWLKVLKMSQGGREQVLRFMKPGETFNEVGVFANRPNPATAIALEPAGVWFIPRQSLQQLVREDANFAEQLIAKLAERLLYLVSLVSDLSLLPVTGRLAHLLLTDATDDILKRPRWYTQSELAARLGTVPDVIQRVLRQLEADGLIEVEKEQIRIKDRQRLKEAAEQ